MRLSQYRWSIRPDDRSSSTGRDSMKRPFVIAIVMLAASLAGAGAASASRLHAAVTLERLSQNLRARVPAARFAAMPHVFAAARSTAAAPRDCAAARTTAATHDCAAARTTAAIPHDFAATRSFATAPAFVPLV